jgi:hypothetical protein
MSLRCEKHVALRHIVIVSADDLYAFSPSNLIALTMIANRAM